MSRSERTSHVRLRREQCQLTQTALAKAAGISRQSLSAIEAGRAEPSVSTALRIAAALAQPVEALFGDDSDDGAIVAELAGDVLASAEQRVALAHIRDRWVAHALPARDGLGHAAHGIGRAQVGARKGSVRVEPLQPLALARETVVLAGCAPALGVLAQRLNADRGPGRFLWLEQSSSAALRSLAQGHAHVAGVHWQEKRGGEPNVAAVRRGVAKTDLTLVTLASWHAGLIVRAGNPLGIRAAADLARRGIRIAAREPGAGARQLLERQLQSARLAPERVLEHALIVHGQLDVGRAIAFGAADVGLAMESAALAFGLDFIPLAQERFDLVMPRRASEDARCARLLDVLSSASFRRELGSLGGYDPAQCGATVAEIRSA